MAQKEISSSFKPALLTKAETQWLLGKTVNLSKSFEYDLRKLMTLGRKI
jgi:hypothetical protein